MNKDYYLKILIIFLKITRKHANKNKRKKVNVKKGVAITPLPIRP
jgi:hypothetical protein